MNNEYPMPVTFTAEDKEHLDWVYKLHRYGVPLFGVALIGGFIWWRKGHSGPSLR